MSNQKGFTLIELLVVVIIIGILAAIVFVSVDPAKRFGDARDARRKAEVVSILNALLKYQIDNVGALPAGIDSTSATYQVIGTDVSGCNTTCTAVTTEAACLDLTSALVDTYLSSIPVDPLSGSDANTDYYLNKSASGRLTIGACDPDNAAAINTTR